MTTRRIVEAETLEGTAQEIGHQVGAKVVLPMIRTIAQDTCPLHGPIDFITALSVYLVHCMHELHGADGSEALVSALASAAKKMAAESARKAAH